MAHGARRTPRRPAARVLLLIAVAHGCGVSAAWAQSKKPAPPVAAPTAASAPAAAEVDVELLLRACPAEAHRNAKLYALRAHRIDLMHRSGDRQQARSTFSAEQQMSGLMEQLRDKPRLGADLQRIEDALTGLTELTIQEPLVSQVTAAEGLADQAAKACQAVATALKTPDASPAAALVEVVTGMHVRAQRMGRAYLVAQLLRQPASQVAALTRDDVAAFDVLLGTLRQAGAGDDRLRNATNMIAAQWVFMKRALVHPGETDRSRLEDVGRSSEHLFEILRDQLIRLRAGQRAAGAVR